MSRTVQIQALGYVYDGLGRLRDIQAGTNTFTYAYSGASQLIQSLTRPNGSYTEYQGDYGVRLDY